MAPCYSFSVWYTFDDASSRTEEVLVNTLLPVKVDVGRSLTGLECRIWVNMYLDGGPSMEGSARGGTVLKVEEAYLSSSHSGIRPLFSSVHANVSSDGRGGAVSRWGQEHVALCGVWCGCAPPIVY